MSDLGDHSQLRYGPPPPTPPQSDASMATAQQLGQRLQPPQPGEPAASTRHTPRMPPAAWPLVVLVAAAIAGGVVGAGVAALSLAASGDGDAWAELGAFLFGVMAGLAAFAVAYVVGLVFASRRAFPPGERVVPFALALGIPIGITMLVSAVVGVAASSETELPPAAGIPVAVTLLAAGPLAFAWGDTNAGRRRLFVAVAAVAALVVGIAGVGIGVERARTSRIVAQLPLVLFEGQTADAPFQGWRRDSFSNVWVTENRRTFTEQGQSAYLKYMTPGGVAFLTMHTEVGACQDTVTYSCRVDGTIRGSEQRIYTRVASYGSYLRSEEFIVLVHADGSAVSVNAPDTGRTYLTSPATVLESLVRVDRETFERAAGAPIRVR